MVKASVGAQLHRVGDKIEDDHAGGVWHLPLPALWLGRLQFRSVFQSSRIARVCRCQDSEKDGVEMEEKSKKRRRWVSLTPVYGRRWAPPCLLSLSPRDD